MPSSGPIQQIPQGLLGLLQLKNLGRNPVSLDDNVQPTFDMMPLWLLTSAEQDTLTHQRDIATGAGQVLGFATNPIVVPEGEVWWVHRYSLEVVLAAVAGDVANDVIPALLLNTTGTLVFQLLNDRGVSGTSVLANASQVGTSCGGFYAPPGSQLGFHYGSAVSATVVSVYGLAWVTKMQI